MTLNPNSIQELSQMLKNAHDLGAKVESCQIEKINAVVDYTPEDMTATVEAGMRLADFQGHLRSHGQWLPIDPPNADRLSVGELLAGNWSGPRRYGYGPIRDYLIGIKVAMADGTIIKAGGKVVKNVAGYDLCKLFIGSKGTLGIIVEATFKLRPLPEDEVVLEKSFDSLDELGKSAEAILNSAAEPVVLDAHNLAGKLTVVTSFAGIREDVGYQTNVARDLGFAEAGSLNYNDEFWINRSGIKKASVLPSETVNLIRTIAAGQFVARLGNGIIYYKGAELQKMVEMPVELMRRLKHAYDPKGILPDYRV
jgi:FAD/FMN-containing dehydrogenase